MASSPRTSFSNMHLSETSDSLICPVILCGGSGTRLWPRSRKSLPKPFLPLLGNRTLFEATLARFCGHDFAPPIIVTGQMHVRHVDNQCGSAAATIIVEPVGRSTAPAIALAAALLPPDAVMLVAPSDHHIVDNNAFERSIRQAADLARDGMLVALGIEARTPETGFGYIRRGENIDGRSFRISEFVEKPDQARAEAFLASGSYYWNGGIFCFTAGTYLTELEKYRPALAENVRIAIAGGAAEGWLFYPEAASFDAIEGVSIDYAVMEHTDRAAVVPVDMGWSDIGTWFALKEARAAAWEADVAGNIVRGAAELVDCRDVMVESDGPRVSVIGLNEVIVIVDGNDVLVTSSQGAQKVGGLRGACAQ